MTDAATIVSSIIVGAAMCVAMAQATDLMMDLKTGYLVGATPAQTTDRSIPRQLAWTSRDHGPDPGPA